MGKCRIEANILKKRSQNNLKNGCKIKYVKNFTYLTINKE